MGRHGQDGFNVYLPAFHVCVDFELSGISHQGILGVYTLETPVFNNRNDHLVIVLLKFKGGRDDCLFSIWYHSKLVTSGNSAMRVYAGAGYLGRNKVHVSCSKIILHPSF